MKDWQSRLKKLKSIDSVILLSRKIAKDSSPEEVKKIMEETELHIQHLESEKINKDYML